MTRTAEMMEGWQRVGLCISPLILSLKHLNSLILQARLNNQHYLRHHIVKTNQDSCNYLREPQEANGMDQFNKLTSK